MSALPKEDMSRTYLEHSMVIHNFVIKIGKQIKDSLCRVFGDRVQYQWRENNDEAVIPDWRKKQVEIYLSDWKEDGASYPYLFKTVTK